MTKDNFFNVFASAFGLSSDSDYSLNSKLYRFNLYSIDSSSDSVCIPEGNLGDYCGIILYANSLRFAPILISSPRSEGKLFLGSFWDGVFKGWKTIV